MIDQIEQQTDEYLDRRESDMALQELEEQCYFDQAYLDFENGFEPWDFADYLAGNDILMRAVMRVLTDLTRPAGPTAQRLEEMKLSASLVKKEYLERQAFIAMKKNGGGHV